ncbi:MAG: type IX secretion system membrane protein PorP/SprF [Muribaculum sp.]|nr:type IX secretion system membrane protein PorP/SprF [Muribaculum sp.]MDE6457949.1 type IX secretion system membrane protein PorP/SprF [Muribaculum sp.]
MTRPMTRKSYSPLLLLLLCVLLFPDRTTAQVDAQFTQYFEVPSYYNAGAIGTSDFIRIRGGSRLQWVGIPKAPKTFLVTGDMPFKLMNKRFGVGLLMQQESMGLYSNMTIGAQAAYKLKLFKGELSIGLQLGFIDESFKGSEVILPDGDDYHQGTDEGIPTTDVHGTSFDLGLGVWYTHRYFWAGLSATHLNEPTVTMSTDGTDGKEYEFKAGRVVYFMAGSNIPIKNTLFEIQPSFLVKSDFTFTTGEITARVRYNKFLTAGVGYRVNDAISLILGAEYKNFFLGYSYDYATSAISRASNGSHEIWGGYRLKLDLGEKNRHKHKSIRIM